MIFTLINIDFPAKTIIENYASKGVIGPINALWTFYLCEGDSESADKIWKKYLQKADIVFFQKVLESSRTNKNVKLLTKLIEDLKTNTNITKNTLANVYSHQLDIFLDSNSFNDACKVLDNVVNDGIPLNCINKRKLLRLKDAIEESGGTFKYEF